jgi:hypothetical protein
MTLAKPRAPGSESAVHGDADPYGGDVYAWASQQAQLLRAGLLGKIDALQIAEELDDVARSEYDALESALTVLLMHMLKWDHQSEFRSRSWEATIREQRLRVRDRMEDSPSLKSKLEQAIRRAYRYGRVHASGETGLDVSAFPADCPYSWADIIEREFAMGEPRP